MKVLDVKDYGKALAPLNELSINTLFVKSVICGQMQGSVYVDDCEKPEVFYIVHPYGMSLLFGAANKENFNRELADCLLNRDGSRSRHEWLQVYPEGWKTRVEELFGSRLLRMEPGSFEYPAGYEKATDVVVENVRVNFDFHLEAHTEAQRDLGGHSCEIIETTREIYENMKGSVIPRHFWRDADQFLSEGKGYTLICDGEAASTAFAAYRLGNRLEIGIETEEKFRGKGFAKYASLALIDYCIENNLEPVWSCRRQNEASYRLACGLGFVPTLHIPYYRLPIRIE